MLSTWYLFDEFLFKNKAESEKWPDLPRNRFQQTQTFLTIAVNFRQNRQVFDRQNQKGGGVGHTGLWNIGM